MPRNIVVSSNCQAASIAVALQAMFPNDKVVPVYLPADFKATSSPEVVTLVDRLLSCDIWVTIGHENILYDLNIRSRNSKITSIRIPTIAFSAFHPDLAYVKEKANGNYVVPHYNSAIAVWAYNKGLSVEQTAKLFNKDNFKELGYFSVWQNSVKYLSETFEKTDINFKEFFPAVKREGIFMHSVNHPLPFVLVHLAKLIAVRIGAEKTILEAPITIPDALADTVWPIYPEVGDSLALAGMYMWKMNGKYINSLEAYIDFAFKNYMSKDLLPGSIEITNPNLAIYDRVLGGMHD